MTCSRPNSNNNIVTDDAGTATVDKALATTTKEDSPVATAAVAAETIAIRSERYTVSER